MPTLDEVCDCVTARGWQEQMLASEGCNRCGGTGQVTVSTIVDGLDRLNNDIDELASRARDLTEECPGAKGMLDLAWYFTEEAVREYTGKHCSMNCKPGGWCSCCHHYDELKNKAERIRRML